MNSMFTNCYELTSLDLSNFATNNVGGTKWNGSKGSMEKMFSGCSGLTSLNISSFNTSKVPSFRGMFYRCNELTTIDVSHFDTGQAENMSSMFDSCSSLTQIDVSNFNTVNSRSFMNMFYNCANITTLDLSNFDTNKAYSDPQYLNFYGMFTSTKKLWKLVLGPNIKLKGEVINIGLKNPVVGTKIDDLTGNFYCRKANWQEVGTGTDHEPNGLKKTADEIVADSLIARSTATTYVWDQEGKAELTLPATIDFGTKNAPISNPNYVSEKNSVTITDNRNVRAGRKWELSVLASNLKKIDEPVKAIKGYPLSIKTDTATLALNPTAILATGTGTGIGIQEVFTKDWQLVFKSLTTDIPAQGRYEGNLTFTLVNTTP